MINRWHHTFVCFSLSSSFLINAKWNSKQGRGGQQRGLNTAKLNTQHPDFLLKLEDVQPYHELTTGKTLGHPLNPSTVQRLLVTFGPCCVVIATKIPQLGHGNKTKSLNYAERIKRRSGQTAAGDLDSPVSIRNIWMKSWTGLFAKDLETRTIRSVCRWQWGMLGNTSRWLLIVQRHQGVEQTTFPVVSVVSSDDGGDHSSWSACIVGIYDGQMCS